MRRPGRIRERALRVKNRLHCLAEENSTFPSLPRSGFVQHPKYLSRVLNNTQNRDGMHYMDEEAARLVVRFLRSATVNHHVTPLATGSSAARRLARVAAARRGTAGRRRSVSPRAREPGGTGPSGRVRAFRPDRSSWRLCTWCHETAHQPASPKAAGDSVRASFF